MKVYFSDGSKFTSLLDLVYPIGAVYCTESATTPGDFFGGTWTQITGRFLVGMGGAGTSNTEDHFGATTGFDGWTHDTVGATGGQGWVTLTTAQIPSHTHTCSTNGNHSHTANSAGSHTHAVVRKDNQSTNLAPTRSLSNHTEGLNGSAFGGDVIVSNQSWTDGGARAVMAKSAGAHTHSTTTNGNHSHTIGNTGGNSGHNNMPPYYVVYIWRRTA